MARHKKKNKIKRYLAVFKRRFKRLNRKQAWRWLKVNLKQHPFILGLLILIWVEKIFIKRIFRKHSIIELLKSHLFIFILWLVLVTLSNLLRDKFKVRWYLKKRFIFFTLLLFPPLGLIFLWSGSQFKRTTKIFFTILFASYFIISQIYYNIRYEKLMSKTPLESIVEMITKPKKKIFLKTLDKEIVGSLSLSLASGKSKVRLAASDIASRCSASIVSIKTKDKDGKELGMGSGFIISKDGVIATNFHVMESAYQAEVKIGENVFKQVYLLKGIPDLDMAILKIEAKDLPALSIGDSDSLIDGQFVIVLGNPWGFERSVSSGIVSAVRSKGDIKVIQMTAPVSMGSSGGPVLNEYAEVVGITTLASFFMAQNLNFAIPINYLTRAIKEK